MVLIKVFLVNLFFLSSKIRDEIDLQKTKQEIVSRLEPVFDTIFYFLYFLLAFFIIVKVILLAKDLVQYSDEPEKRSEVKKAFLYVVFVPVIIFVVATIIHVLIKTLILN